MGDTGRLREVLSGGGPALLVPVLSDEELGMNKDGSEAVIRVRDPNSRAFAGRVRLSWFRLVLLIPPIPLDCPLTLGLAGEALLPSEANVLILGLGARIEDLLDEPVVGVAAAAAAGGSDAPPLVTVAVVVVPVPTKGMLGFLAVVGRTLLAVAS